MPLDIQTDARPDHTRISQSTDTMQSWGSISGQHMKLALTTCNSLLNASKVSQTLV